MINKELTAYFQASGSQRVHVCVLDTSVVLVTNRLYIWEKIRFVSKSNHSGFFPPFKGKKLNLLIPL